MKKKLLALALVSLMGVESSEGISFNSINKDHFTGGGAVLAVEALGVATFVGGMYAWRRFVTRSVQQPASNNPLEMAKIEGLSLDNFIGQDELVNIVKGYIKIINDTKTCEELGGKPLRGLFINGTDKNGKTLLSKIIAAELGFPVIEIKGDEVKAAVDKLSIKVVVKAIFDAAKDKMGKERGIIFFKDFHKNDRKDGLADFNKVLLEELKQLDSDKDGFNPFIICENKIKDRLDFSTIGIEMIKIEVPSRAGRVKLLEHFLQQTKLEEGLVVEDVADEWGRRLRLASAGEMEHFVNSVALVAAQQGDKCIKKVHFEGAFLKEAFGDRSPVRTTEEELKKVAYHEAGHALADLFSGKSVLQITVVPRGMATGLEMSEGNHEFWYAYNKNEMLREVIGAFGGFCAEKLVYGAVTGGPVSDLMRANSVLYEMVCRHGMGEDDLEAAIEFGTLSEKMKEKFDMAVNKLRSKCLDITMNLLEEHRDLLDRLAESLLEKETLYQDEIYAITGAPKDEVELLL